MQYPSVAMSTANKPPAPKKLFKRDGRAAGEISHGTGGGVRLAREGREHTYILQPLHLCIVLMVDNYICMLFARPHGKKSLHSVVPNSQRKPNYLITTTSTSFLSSKSHSNHIINLPGPPQPPPSSSLRIQLRTLPPPLITSAEQSQLQY